MKRSGAAAALAAALVGIALYAPTRNFGFLALDDDHFVETVPFVHDRSLENLRDLVSRPVFGAWHPLHQASYALDAAVLGDRPGSFHAGNVLVYGVLCALVVLLARRLGRSVLAAFGAGVLFAVHPAHVENVAWISARKDLLSAALGLGSLAVYLGPRRDGPRYALALGLMTLALLAKSVAGVLVLVLVAKALIERRLDRREALALAPFVALAALAFLIHARAQASIGGVVGPFGGSWVEQGRLALRTVARYPLLALYPFGLTVHPPFPVLGPFPDRGDAASLLVVAAALAAFAFGARRSAPWALPIAIFFLPLLPIANLVPFPAFVQDRYLLLPTIGLALLAGDALDVAAASRRGLAFATFGILAGGLAASAASYEHAWRSDVALWESALERHPDDLDALEGAGAAALRAGNSERGTWLLESVLARAPLRFEANFELALAAWRRGDREAARRHLEAASRSGSNLRWRAFVLLGELALERDDLGGAQAALEQAAALSRAAEIELGLARLALARGRIDEAVRRADAAVTLEPGVGGARAGRAAVLRAAGRGDEAAVELGKARALGAGGPDVAALAALLALDRGDRAAARALLAAEPASSAETLVARARLAAEEGDAPRARELVSDAVSAIGSGALRHALAEPPLERLLR
jgi:Flp pilus assembly protein TadD